MVAYWQRRCHVRLSRRPRRPKAQHGPTPPINIGAELDNRRRGPSPAPEPSGSQRTIGPDPLRGTATPEFSAAESSVSSCLVHLLPGQIHFGMQFPWWGSAALEPKRPRIPVISGPWPVALWRASLDETPAHGLNRGGCGVARTLRRNKGGTRVYRTRVRRDNEGPHARYAAACGVLVHPRSPSHRLVRVIQTVQGCAVEASANYASATSNFLTCSYTVIFDVIRVR